ncbi:MAG: hypothetical protein KME32_03435 [Mojavia pulchra JT2-VF2]|uniref:Uncharacterized protein n=1 Tax=Mojavia pulchra JT2-VF2 TaxID=287848 RepID=A0A951PW53_9NOST|nr:hypothetical protein [Mojavia pulchra JT2-VF2]
MTARPLRAPRRHWLPYDASCLKSGNPPTALAPQCPKRRGEQRPPTLGMEFTVVFN